MSYVALYRRFRPQGFSELVGQEAVRRTLEQAIADGRVAGWLMRTCLPGLEEQARQVPPKSWRDC